jgi:UDP-N-acetylglucosamine--N-acetylmuramyl-(pentapeptide) pyrophosphoryl-undecaprenol N-acetylglucosamine transferase
MRRYPHTSDDHGGVEIPGQADSRVLDQHRHNARHMASLGAALALDGDVSPATLKAALGPLLADPARRAAVAAGARAQGRPDAAERLADANVVAASYTT